MLLIKSYLAILYYNIEEKESYDINNIEDRQRAERNFAKKKVFDKRILETAYQEYLKEQEREFNVFKKAKL